MIYLWLKYIHVLSSTILFGTGLGTAAVMMYGHWRRDIPTMAALNQYAVFVDWFFTGSSGLVQIVTGLWMVYLAGYSFTSFWVMGGIIGYFIAACCWFPVVYLQIRLSEMTTKAATEHTSLSPEYTRYFRWWIILGCIAFVSLLFVFYLMVVKPL